MCKYPIELATSGPQCSIQNENSDCLAGQITRELEIMAIEQAQGSVATKAIYL